MLPLISPAPFDWFFLITAAALLVGAVIFSLGILKGKEIEARLQRRSQKLSRSILGGVFSEQVAPFLPDFPKDLKASEARFIGKPIDFLIFKGMDDQNFDAVVLVEVRPAIRNSRQMSAVSATQSKPSACVGTSGVYHDIAAIRAPNAPEQTTS
ncbi:MAG TPA: Holliday junction resolvase-like protein [Terriglobales bacterium]|nr:Holliday junction resolvase-like protein [Terriglobales bacterium]